MKTLDAVSPSTRLFALRRGWIRALVLALLLCPIAVQAQTKIDDAKTEQDWALLRPGVIVDTERSAVFAMRPGGGIEAIDVHSGKVLWATSAADRPLLVVAGHLLAQIDSHGPRLELVTLGLDTMGQAVDRFTIVLPPGTDPAIDDDPGRSFTLRATARDDAVFVQWTERRQRVAAIQALQTAAEVRSGAVRLDLAKGEYSTLDSDMRQSFVTPPPDLVGAEVMTSVAGPQFRSAGGAYAMTSERVANAGVWDRYEWRIWRRDAQGPIGRLWSFQRYSPFVVVDPTLIMEVPPHSRTIDGRLTPLPLSLAGRDLETGVERWSRPIRDTAYRGPLPH